MKKNYTASPLPFQGQKRKFLRQFREALKTYPKDATYVDLFGGSGLLSHTVKSEYADAKVIYNDFDNFSKRIAAIPQTNLILERLREITKELPRGKTIPKKEREEIIQFLGVQNKKGFVDFITISSSLLFSMNYVTSFDKLIKEGFYAKVRKSNFINALDYLQGIDIVSMDYKSLFNNYKSDKNVIFLVDPPYLSTDVSTYKNYWKLTDYLEVLEVLSSNNYFYFTSSKSSIVELCEWIGQKTASANPFHKAMKVEMATSPSYNSTYTDIMLYSYSNSTQ